MDANVFDDLPIDDAITSTARIAKDRRAPPDERHDASMDMARQLAPAVPQMDMKEIAKAAQWAHMVNRRTANASGRPKSGNNRDDIYGIFRQYDYVRRPSPLGFQELRMLMQHDPVLSSIVFTFMRHVSSRAKPVEYDHEHGFRITLQGRKGRLSEDEQRRVQWLENFIMSCGAEFDPFKRKLLRRDSLIEYLKKSTMDTLVLDAMPTEIIRTNSGRVHGWKHIDGATAYLTDDGLEDDARIPDGLEPHEIEDLPDPENVEAVEVSDGTTVVNWFGYDQFMYNVRNPRPDVFGQGYGIAETELMIRIITALLNTFTYNKRAYEDNHIPPGFLTLFGEFPPEQIEAFKSEWAAYVAGVSNAWNLPVLVARDNNEAGAAFTKTGVDVSEMHFIKWTTLLIAIEHALYGMDPEENGFESWTSRGATMSDASIEGKLANTKIKGLYPLLQHHESHLNDIIMAVDPDARFKFTGFISAKESWERDSRALLYGELRERQGLEPTGNEMLDNAPIDVTMQGVYLQAQQEAMQGFGGEGLEGQPQEGLESMGMPPEEGGEWPEGGGDGELDEAEIEKLHQALLMDEQGEEPPDELEPIDFGATDEPGEDETDEPDEDEGGVGDRVRQTLLSEEGDEEELDEDEDEEDEDE